MELTDKDFKIVIINMILIFMEASLVAQTVKLLPVCPQCGDPGSIPGLGRSPGEGNGNPLQHSWLENPMDRGAWWATVHGITDSIRLPWCLRW